VAEFRRKISMKKLSLFSLAVASLFVLNSTRAATLDDVQFWVGSGANQAALVVDWNDGRSAESLLWGFRWDGSATGLDMFQAVVNADSRLFAHLGGYVWGTAIHGIGYDLDGDGSFGVSPSLSFDGGGLVTTSAPDDLRTPTDGADHYLEGWNAGFWGYNLKASANDAWASAVFGPAERVLADGVWDGYSFAPGFNFTDPSEPIAATLVPEPTAFALLSISVLLLSCARRQQ
jgi:hypothetical protein